MFSIVTHAHEEHDHQGSRPLPNSKGCNDTETHQRMRDHLATERSFDHLPENGIACNEDEAPSKIPGNEICHALKEAKPFTGYHHQKDDTEDQPQEGQNGTGKAGKRT